MNLGGEETTLGLWQQREQGKDSSSEGTHSSIPVCRSRLTPTLLVVYVSHTISFPSCEALTRSL